MGTTDASFDASEHTARDAGIELVGIETAERVLEIGCGTGQALVSFARAVGDRGCVCGIDLSNGMIDVARRRLQDQGLLPAVHLEVADARHLPFRSGQFDVVFMSFTLELFEADDRTAVLSEVRRVLREGGRLGVVAMSGAVGCTPTVEIYRWLHRHFPHIADGRPIDLGSELQRAAFAIQRQRSMDIWSLPVEAAVAIASDARAPEG